MRDQTRRERVRVAGREIEERDDDERSGESGQHEVRRRRRARVAARLEVAAKPQQREPGDRIIGPAAQPVLLSEREGSVKARAEVTGSSSGSLFNLGAFE